MIQKLRNPYVMKWGLYFIIGLTIPAFVLFYGFGSNQPGGPVPTGPLVTLETDEGTVELDRFDMERIKREATAYYTGVALTSFQPDPQQARAIQGMIHNAIEPLEVAEFAVGQVALEQRLNRQDIRVTDRQVEMQLTEQGFTAEQLSNYLRQTGMTEYEFASQIRSDIRTTMAAKSVERIARTSLLELWNEYLIANEQLTISYVSQAIPFRSEIEVSDEDVEARYQELVEDEDPTVIDPEKRVYEYVKLAAPAQTTPQPTEEQLQEAYDAIADDDPEFIGEGGYRVRHILAPVGPAFSDAEKAEARASIEAARERITGGEEFSAVADEISLDLRNMDFKDENTSPTLRGGEIPYVLSGDETDAWGEDWMNFITSAEPGDISEVMSTPQGYSVAQVIERVTPGKQPFEQVRDQLAAQVREELQAEAEETRNQQLEENLGRMREAKATQTTLAGIARAVNSTVELSSPTVTTSAFIRGIGNLSRESTVLEFLDVGDTSDVLQTSAGDTVVLRVKEEIPEGIFPLDQVADRIRRDIQREREVARAEEKAEQIKAKVSAGDSFTSAVLAVDSSLTPQRLDAFKRSEPPQELQRVIDIAGLMTRAQEGELLTAKSGNVNFVNEVVLMSIEKVESPTMQQFMEEIRDYEGSLLAAKRQGYLEEFRRDAKNSLNAEFSDVFGIEEDRGRRDM